MKPYTVVYDQKDECWRIEGPSRVDKWFLDREGADELAEALSDAFIAGGGVIDARHDAAVEAVADAYSMNIEDVSAEEIMGRSRLMHRVAARHLAISIMRNELRMPLVEIGKRMGMHHASVLYAVGKCASNMEVAPILRKVHDVAVAILRDEGSERLPLLQRSPGNA